MTSAQLFQDQGRSAYNAERLMFAGIIILGNCLIFTLVYLIG